MQKQVPTKEGKRTQAGVHETLTRAVLDGAYKCIESHGDFVALENVSGQAGKGNKSSQRIVGGGFLLTGTMVGLAFLSQGRNGGAFPALFGLLFALGGYGIVAYRDRFVVQPEAEIWMRDRGIFPFARKQHGFLAQIKGLRLSRETRQSRGNQSSQSSCYDVWAAQVIWQEADWQPLELRLLDLPTTFVDQEAAQAVHREYARLIHLPVIEDVALPAQEQNALLTDGAGEGTPVVPVVLPRRFAGSRISTAVDPDGTAHIVLQPRLNVISLLGPLVPLLGFIWFMWEAESNHRASLANMPVLARATFERGISPLTFFLPIGILIGVVSLTAFVFMVIKACSRRHLVVTSDTLSACRNGFGREWGKTSVPLQELTDVRAAQKGSAGSGTVSVNGVSVDLSFSDSSPRAVLVYGPHQADLSLGGEELSASDFDWYLQATRALLDPATREAVCSQIALPPLDQSPLQSQVAAKAGRKWTRYLFPGVIGITLLNSYAGGFAVAERWTDANGTLFIRWHSLWRLGGYARSQDGQEQTALASYTPFSASTSGKLPESVGAASDHHWRIALTGTAVVEIDQARQGFAGARAADKARQRSKMVAEAQQFEAALPKAPDAGQLNAVGDRFQSAGKWDKAIQYFTRAAQAARKPADALYAYQSIATCCYAQEKRDDAIAALKSALAIRGLSDKEHKGLTADLKRVESAQGSLHKKFLRIPGDHFPGEAP